MLVPQTAVIFVGSRRAESKKVESLLQQAGVQEITVDCLKGEGSTYIKDVVKLIKETDLCLIFLNMSNNGSGASGLENFTELPMNSIEVSSLCKEGLILLVDEKKVEGHLEDTGLRVITLNENGYEEKLNQYIKGKMKGNDTHKKEHEKTERFISRLLYIMQAYTERGYYSVVSELFEEVCAEVSIRDMAHCRMLREKLAYSYWTRVKNKKRHADRWYEKIETIYEEIIEQTPDQNLCRYYRNLAYINKLQRRYTRSKSNYVRALKYIQGTSRLNKERTVLFLQYNLAEVYVELDEYERAEELYKGIRGKSRLIGLTDTDLLHRISLAYLEQKKYSLAKNGLERVYDEKINNQKEKMTKEVNLILQLGDTYYNLEELDRAEEKYIEVISIMESTGELKGLLYVMYKLLLVYCKDRERKRRGIVDVEKVFYQIQDKLSREEEEEDEKKYEELEIKNLNEIELEVYKPEYREKSFDTIRVVNQLQQMIRPNRTENEMIKIRDVLREVLVKVEEGDVEETNGSVFTNQISAKILECLARSYKIQGAYLEAKRVYESRRLSEEALQGYRHELAEIYRAQGRLQDAEIIFWNTLDGKGLVGKESPAAVEERMEIIRQCLLNKNYKEANKQCEWILKVINSEKIVLPEYEAAEWGTARYGVDSFGENSISVESFELLLYELKFHQRKYGEVKEWYEKKRKSRHNSGLLTSMFVCTYQALQEYDKAGVLLDQALKRARGGNVDERLDLEKQLVKLYMNKEEREIAERICMELLRKRYARGDIGIQRVAGNISLKKGSLLNLRRRLLNLLGRQRVVNDVSINKIKYTLSEIYSVQGRFREAEILCKQALESSKKILGRLHPDTIVQHRKLSTIYINEENFERAEEVLRDALKDAKRIWGEGHGEVLNFEYDLARVYVGKKSDKAEMLLKGVVQQSKNIFGEEYPDTLRFINGLASFYIEKENKKTAKKLFSDVLRQRNILGERHPDICQAERGIGIIDRTSDFQGEERGKEEIKQQTLVSSITNRLLLYYKIAGDNKYTTKILQTILKGGYLDEAERHEKKLKLAVIYHKEERYLKAIDLYHEVIQNRDMGPFEDKEILFMTLRLLSSSYLKLKAQGRYVKGVSAWMEWLMKDAELRFGCTDLGEIREIKEMINKSCNISPRNSIKYALRQNNESIRSQFVVENFLDIKRFDAMITPLTCLFGDNHAGKTVIMKILYACQTWAYKKVKDTNVDEKYSKDSFLQDEHKKGREESSSEENSLNKKLKEIIDKRGDKSHEKKEIDILKEGKDFFDSRLKTMIKFQIQSITDYIDRKKDPQQVLEEITKKGLRGPLKISGKNHFFGSNVFYDRSERGLKIELNWGKIKQLNMRIAGDTMQLQIDILDEDEEIALYYYILKGESAISIAPKLPIYAHSSTIFFVREMDVTNIKICILNILFNCTPFVFFEGTGAVFPAHRTGLSIFLPNLSSVLVGVDDDVSQEDLDVVYDILMMKGRLRGDWRIEDENYHNQKYLGKDYGIRYQREQEAGGIAGYLYGRGEDSIISYLYRQRSGKNHDVQRLGSYLHEVFRRIEEQEVDIVSKGGAALEMVFHKMIDNHNQETRKSSEVATSSLSLSFLNMYMGRLKQRFEKIEGGFVENEQFKTQEEQITEIMKYQELSQVIFYDEPENSLHPHRIIKVIEFLFHIYRRLRDHGIPWSLFCITHSPRVLRLLLYGAIKTFGGDRKKIKEHYSPIEFVLDEEDGLYVGTQLEIDEDVEYEKYPFSEINEKEYRMKEEAEMIVEYNSIEENLDEL